jgi:hypothetical protein
MIRLSHYTLMPRGSYAACYTVSVQDLVKKTLAFTYSAILSLDVHNMFPRTAP